ncbi:sulfotransferase family protein [Patiriisocius hiemis]|uniref:Sulfotransferase domain-containing protein n=1 Tax=Patiriisocius hiemis TaxID=3075604 RepID=A0ABU2YC52_9FLAO|nr:sulfotransferase domain-containing protein [Constantimarinum sp. W242]MDT0555766.1 sulfotransferase domain-containing protein [Constantimarinum sp. W242]
MKVDFLLIGAAKSATTSLCNALTQHPDICFSEPKEPQFFSESNWRDKLDSYHSLFKKNTKLYGEGSTNYSKHPHYNKNIHNDIYEYNPEMKIIYIMRNPVDRIISYYTHTYNRGHETIENINNAVLNNIHYIDTGKYAMQIKPYQELFGEENVLLLFFEDFIKSYQQVLDSIFEFLDIDAIEVDEKYLNANKSFDKRVLHHKYDNPKTIFEKVKKVLLILKNYTYSPKFIDKKPILTRETKQYIINHVSKDINEIEIMTGRDLSHWLKIKS